MFRSRASLFGGFGLAALCGTVLTIVACGGGDDGNGNTGGTPSGGSSGRPGGGSPGGGSPSGGSPSGGSPGGGSPGAGAGGITAGTGGALGTPYDINIVVDDIRFLTALPGGMGGGGAGGTGGTGGGGTGGGGTGGGGTGGGGTGGGGTGGAAGGTAGGGGTGGAAGGTAGAAGAGGAPVTACKATAPLLTDFAAATFGMPPGLNGGTYVYPNAMSVPASTFPLMGAVAGGVWTITGKVGDYSGFGLYVNCGAATGMIDASEFKGVAFDISGNAGPAGRVQFMVAIAANETAMPIQPSASVPVTATKTTHSFAWNQLTGGMPVAMVNPAQILQLRWSLAWPPPTGGGGAGGGGAGGAAGSSGAAGTAGSGGTTGGGGAGGTAGAGSGGGGSGGTAGSAGAGTGGV